MTFVLKLPHYWIWLTNITRSQTVLRNQVGNFNYARYQETFYNPCSVNAFLSDQKFSRILSIFSVRTVSTIATGLTETSVLSITLKCSLQITIRTPYTEFFLWELRCFMSNVNDCIFVFFCSCNLWTMNVSIACGQYNIPTETHVLGDIVVWIRNCNIWLKCGRNCMF